MIAYGPALQVLYDNREAVADGAVAGWKKIFGVDGKVGFVGPGGSGKTVLFEYLTGVALKDDYDLPGRSYQSEKGKLKAEKVKSGIHVAVGQIGEARRLDYEKIFSQKNPVDVVVFFSNYGYSEFREDTTIGSVSAQGLSVSDYRKASLRRELEEFTNVVERTIQANLNSKATRPAVLINAINKIDLFHSELGDAIKHYSLSGDSKFSEVSRNAMKRLGEERFSYEVIPVCSQLVDLSVGADIVAKSDLSEEMRDAYVWQFKTKLSQIVGGVSSGV